MGILAKRVAHQATSVFDAINQYASGYDTINLGQGRPDFDGPPEILQAVADAILTGKANQYAPGFGVPELRHNIAAHAQRYYGLDIDTNEGIVVTSGACEGVYAAIMAVVNPGDEVILIEPFFDIYRPIVEWAGGIPQYVPLQPPDWSLDGDLLRAAFSDRTRAIVLNNPHNPTGRAFTDEEINLIAELCRTFDVLVISDDVYEHLTYDGTSHRPIASLPDMFERTLTVSSGAKTFSATGWKIGWVMGHPDLIKGVWRIHQNVTFAVNHPAQYGIAAGLALDNRYFERLKALYMRKRQILIDGLKHAGIRVHYEPNAAFYVMGDFSDVYDGSDLDFTKWLISEIGVACIPPASFFCEAHQHIAKNYVRFSYCKLDEQLHQAAERLSKIRERC